MKLWDKGQPSNAAVEDFTVGDDYILDRRLLFYDCLGSIAHAKVLQKAGILGNEETEALISLLRDLSGSGLVIEREDEDVHTALEKILVQKIGETGKKIHTGRSRNDQVMVDLQLWSRNAMLQVQHHAISLCETQNRIAREFPALMPGYTHMQKAMPSSLQLLLGSYVESLLEDLELLETAYAINNRNPLGSAAGYGASLALDREYSARLLGFEGYRNSIYVQARPKLIATILMPLKSFMKTLDRISSDILLFTTGEFDFFSLPDELCTGSSIMPQKKNYDILELIRAYSSVVHGYGYSIDTLGCRLMSGYCRDFQLTKEPLMRSFDIIMNCLEIMKLVFENLKIHRDRMLTALNPPVFATDRAYELVRDGVPFRTAYREVAQHLDSLQIPEDMLAGREHLLFRDYSAELEQARQKWNRLRASNEHVLDELMHGP